MKQFFIAHFKFVIGILIVVVASGAIWYIFSNTAPTLASYTVKQGNVISSVDILGTVSSSNSVDLSFQEAGQISKVYVKEGQSVKKGDSLASLDDSTEQAQLSQEKAILAAAQAKLDELQSGTRPEQLTLYSQQYDDASTALVVAMNNAYLKIQDALVNKTDTLFINGNTVNPTLNIPDPNFGQSDQTAIANERLVLWSALADWKNALATNTTSTDAIENLRTTTAKNISLAESFMNHLSEIVGGISTGDSGMNQNEINVDTSLVNGASQEVTGAANTESAADTAWSSAKNSLALQQAGSQSDDIEAQKDAVAQAQAQIDSAQIMIDHTTITAPFSGVIRNVIAESGMVVSPNVPVLSIINNGIMKINAYASETDVPNIQGNATATVALDAYGNGVKFPAQVTAIDTSETIINGAPSYHVTLYFTEPDSRIRAGMTGDVHVVSAEHDNVLEVPSRLVLGNNGNNFVLVQNDKKNIQRPVTLGVTGDDGMVEIVSGLNAGEKISNF